MHFVCLLKVSLRAAINCNIGNSSTGRIFAMTSSDSERFLPSIKRPALASDTPLFIVFNAASGAGDKQKIQADIASVLREAGRHHEFFLADRPEKIAACVRQAIDRAERSQGAVIVAGGDGTINAAAELTLPTRRPFGLLPQGTFNYTCRTHGIPLDSIEATRALLTARIKPIQVGRVNNRIFLVNASLGLYPQLLEDREKYKEQFGRKRSVAFFAGLATLIQYRNQFELELDHDGKREWVRTPTLFVGNNALQLDQVGLSEADDVQHKQLAAVIVRPVSRMAMLGLALRGAVGRLHSADNVHDFPFTTLNVRRANRKTNRPLKIATDGEVCWMMPPLNFRVDPQPLMLMVPA
jgi:diacylglycerol kinase family enzyme